VNTKVNTIDRRAFLQLSAGALLTTASTQLSGNAGAPLISAQNGLVSVKTASYLWEYSQADDTFRLRDSKNRSIVSGKMQPAVVVAPSGQPTLRVCAPGIASEPQVGAGRLTIRYEEVNGSANLAVTWRFDEDGVWTEPIVYDTPTAQDVVSLHYFVDSDGSRITPSLDAAYVVAPGLLSGSTVSPIVSREVHLDESVWLGRGSFIPGLSQQWGLPVHYFCGFSMEETDGQRNRFTEGRSKAFACGLADLPGGDLFLQLFEGRSSLWIDYRSDLWKHLSGPGAFTLGATLLWTIAPDYYQAIAAYYRGLLQAGIIHQRQRSERRTAIALTPQFCTWGAQIDRHKEGERLDEAFLREIYQELKSSGMKAGLFSIDDKWEGSYGNLVHSETRFPHFEQFLDQLRADGIRIGMWAALMRCEHPADLGLTEDNMLKLPDGKPYQAEFASSHYYILDFTQPTVAKVLADLARRFIRRYKPDLLKFDFGYELPAVGIAAPQDKHWAGERLMLKGLEVAINAMREENPDLVVMYYNLSPLFLDYFDLHSPDDLYMCPGEYEMEANRRFFFSSLLGPLGVPTYGSSGYDWASSPGIWFDSAALGTVGSLNDFKCDEEGESVTPEIVAKYNGIVKVLRQASIFEILPIGSVSFAPTHGAHARSWARMENGQLVLLAFRPPSPGEENPLMDANDNDPWVKDAVRSKVPVVVAAKGRQSIARSDKLAVVAYGEGEIDIRRERGKHAEILSHYFGGAVITTKVPITNGRLKFTTHERDLAGAPLEWIEVSSS
jgi:hypothetical protein